MRCKPTGIRGRNYNGYSSFKMRGIMVCPAFTKTPVYWEGMMYDRNATEKAGLHDLPGAAEFEVYRGSDYPDLGLSEGWYWDIPECRVDCPTTPRIDGRYAYANGPY